MRWDWTRAREDEDEGVVDGVEEKLLMAVGEYGEEEDWRREKKVGMRRVLIL